MATTPSSRSQPAEPIAHKPNAHKPGAHQPGAHQLDASGLALQLSQLAQQYSITDWCLAYSGGVDSQVLLHLLHQIQQQPELQSSFQLNLTAVYINHQLQVESSAWAEHCAEQCAALNIPFQIIAVNAHPETGESPEAAARAARYGAFKKIIRPGMCLLTAQHQDDQAETVLIQLLRGAGAAGLSAMPALSAFAEGWHARPLLNISQQAIQAYAQQHQLKWVEDPSNQLPHYDRNFLRQQIMPALQQRWPAVNKTLSRFASQQVENNALLEELALIDLGELQQTDGSIELAALKQLTSARARNALRYWFKTRQASMPSSALLAQLLQQIKTDSHDNHLCISWGDNELRRFRDALYLCRVSNHDPRQVIEWNGRQPLELPSLGKTLELTQTQTSPDITYVLKAEILGVPLSIRFRQGGERIQPAGRQGHRELKKLFQEVALPEWQRERIPLLYAGDQLVAVVGYWLAEEWVCKGQGVLPCVKDSVRE